MPKKPRKAVATEPFVAHTQPGQMSLAEALQRANRDQGAGRLQQAEVSLRQILAKHPNQPHALHLLGIIAHKVGKIDTALDCVRRAIAGDGTNVPFLVNYTELCRQGGRLDEAIEHGERAVALAPDSFGAHSNLGIAYYDKQDFDAAEIHQKRALDLKPDLASALNNLGSICRERKDLKAAIDYYRQAIVADPNYTEPLNNLGTVLVQDERAAEAIPILEAALQLNSNYSDALCNLGFARNALEQFDLAEPMFLRAIELRPDYAEAHQGLARVFQEKNELDKAVQAATTAVRIAPEKAEVHSTLGQVHSRMGYFDLSVESFDKALALDPALGSALLGKGILYMEAGRLAEAEDLFVHSLAVSSEPLASRFYITQVRKTRTGDDNLAALVEEMKHAAHLPEDKTTFLHFALGKCYEDIKDYDKAFEHYAQGCRSKRASNGYDHEEKMRLFDNVMAQMNRSRIEVLSGHDNPSDVPIFILGMPRSGTTLTEQIIASHPAVYGAGELYDLLNIGSMSTSADSVDVSFGDNFKDLNHEHLAAWGESYIKGLRQRAPDAVRITDKMPANFLLLGLIHLMLPNARIIHMRRNPLDTCLSCFNRLFHSGQDHTYDLVELGSYYRKYVEVMDHWRSVLPEGAFLDLHYEELVSDNETQTRRLIDYCGLEWDDACLEPHKTKRAIRTASVTQVREPIYTSSIERWRCYEKFLGPLIDALGELAPVD